MGHGPHKAEPFPGQSDEERYCRWVLRMADNRLKEQGYPERAAAVTAVNACGAIGRVT